MKLKDKILNKVADKLNGYRTPEYDKILYFDVKGRTKGVFTTYDCEYIKEIQENSKDGIISINHLLDNEFKNSEYNSIYFCDKEKAICIQNHNKYNYNESVFEYFDKVYEIKYLVCDDEHSYNNLKFYINQSSKYNKWYEEVTEIPYKKSFDSLFNKDNLLTNENNKGKETKNNYIEIEGKVCNIKEISSKDDKDSSQVISVMQEYGNSEENIFSIKLDRDMLDKYKDNISVNDKVKINGTLTTYKDKNNQNIIVINCKEIELLNKDISSNFER